MQDPQLYNLPDFNSHVYQAELTKRDLWPSSVIPLQRGDGPGSACAVQLMGGLGELLFSIVCQLLLTLFLLSQVKSDFYETWYEWYAGKGLQRLQSGFWMFA